MSNIYENWNIKSIYILKINYNNNNIQTKWNINDE